MPVIPPVCWLQRLDLHQRFQGYEPCEIAASPLCRRVPGKPGKKGKQQVSEYRKCKAERTAMQRQSEGDTQTNCTAGKLSDDFRLLSCIHYITYPVGHTRTFQDNFSIACFVFLLIVLGSYFILSAVCSMVSKSRYLCINTASRSSSLSFAIASCISADTLTASAF